MSKFDKIFRKMISRRNLKKAYRKYAKEKARQERIAIPTPVPEIKPYEVLSPTDTYHIGLHNAVKMPWMEIERLPNGCTRQTVHYAGSDDTPIEPMLRSKGIDFGYNFETGELEFFDDTLPIDDDDEDNDIENVSDDVDDNSEYDQEMQELEDWYEREGQYAMEEFKHFMESQE